MNCGRCNFENIPGQTRCLRCGSVLVRDRTFVDIYPPRMVWWKRPVRAAARWVRQWGAGGEIRASGRWQQVFARMGPGWEVVKEMAVLPLGVIPGLGNLLTGRLKGLRQYIVLWAVCLFATVFLWGSGIAFGLLGLTIVVHSWIALSAVRPDVVETWRGRIAALLVTAFVFFQVYLAVPRLAGLRGAYSNFGVEVYNIKQNDFVLGRRFSAKGVGLERGALVLFRPVRVVFYGPGNFKGDRVNKAVFGQIIARAGETVEVENGSFFVNGEKLDSRRFPVPAWLGGKGFGITVSDKSYFIKCQYTAGGHGMELTKGMIAEICIVPIEYVDSRVFMNWWPIWRRGFVR